ncbi:MAG: CBS domain-containing protein [Bdellovibrionales bacterium]|nr:CBS domain-containing protein [Bdellovibrionales bacterium]
MGTPSTPSLLKRILLSKTTSSLEPTNPPVSAIPTASIREATEALRRHKIGSILIVGPRGELVGIFTERDLLMKVALSGQQIDQTPIETVMTANPTTMSRSASVARAIHELALGGYRHLPLITDKDPTKFSIISTKNIVDHVHKHISSKITGNDPITIDERNEVDSFFAQDINLLSPSKPVVFHEATTLGVALEALQKANAGCVLATNASGKLSGIFTGRDYVMKVALEELPLSETKLSDVMTPKPQTAVLSTGIAYAFEMFSEGGFRHIPVMSEDEQLVGVLSVKNFFSFLSQLILKELS